MKHLINILIPLLFLGNLFCQTDTNTIYKNLQVKKDYAVITSSLTRGRTTTYRVNDRIVDKATYDKFHTFDNISSCCPCILRSYDENNLLLRESVSCGDCGVGEFKEFYPNGKVKIKGKYKENPTVDWADIFKRGYCNVPTGTWLYYTDLNGTHYLHHIEIWDNGQFIEQRPESKKAEIWGIDLLLNTIKIDSQALTINDIKNLKVVPKYKNKLNNAKLKVKLSISANGYIIKERESSIETLKDINVEEMIKQAGIPDIEKINLTIYIYENDQYIKGFFLKMKK